MKKLLTFSLLFSLAFASCSKENDIVVAPNANNQTVNSVSPEKETEKEDPSQAKKTVTIEVSSDNFATVEIPAVHTSNFDGTYRYTFTPTDKNIIVKITSEVLSTKSIAIYVGNERVTYRRANCAGNEYELSYELDNL